MKKTGYYTLGLSMLLAAPSWANDIYVRDVNVEGLKRVEVDTVLSYVNIPTGQAVSQESLDDSLKNLYNTGLFTDVIFDVKSDGLLTIKVIENPIVNQRYFDGNDKVSEEMLSKETSLNSGSIYDRAKVQEDVQRILTVYKRTGRYATSVVPKIIKRDQNRVDLIYEINEGPLANITKINFIGNKRYSDDDLSNAIMSKESRWYRIFSSSETYDADKSNYDKELLRRFYLKRGYADFKVKSAVAELSPDKTSFVLNYVLDEGQRYQIASIKFDSEIKDVNLQNLAEQVDIQTGEWYDDTKVDSSVQKITEELGKQGFAFVDVVPDLNIDTKNAKMDIVFKVKEGERVFIDRINIKGNTRTHDEVIRREFRIDEGDAFNASKIKASRKNVENLNYFSKVDVKTVPTGANKADINVDVEEKSTGYFNVGIGYSTVNGMLFRTGVTENNFRGMGQQLGLDIGISERTQEYDISFTEPYFMNRNLSAGVDLFRTEEDYQDYGSYDMSSTGGRLRLGWKYTDSFSQYVRYTYKQDEINNVDEDASKYVKEEIGKYNASVIGQTLIYDKRDSAINPKEGYYVSFGNDIAGAGGDEKYAKFDAKVYKYYTFADDYTFKLFTQAGYIFGYGGEDVRLFNRYNLGGSTLRGFDTAGIGARDKSTGDALGGNWMIYSGAEMSFPIGLDEVGIRGRTFADMGILGKPDGINGANDVEYSSTPRVAAGFGFQWLSPMGQIDVDIAFPIIKEDYDETQVFRLNFGTRL